MLMVDVVIFTINGIATVSARQAYAYRMGINRLVANYYELLGPSSSRYP